jgi:D-lactate dehydrogenase (cytochrome)
LRYFWSGTGEHGVGIGKREFLVKELGAGTVALMKAIKRTVDPLGLFNPGKVGTLVLLFPGDVSLLWQLYPDDDSADSGHHT